MNEKPSLLKNVGPRQNAIAITLKARGRTAAPLGRGARLKRAAASRSPRW